MLDYFIISLYLLTLLTVSLYSYSKVKNKSFLNYASTNNYYNASIFLLIATLFGSSVGGGTIFGISEKIFTYNLSYSYALILSLPIELILAYYILPKINKHRKALTVGDIIHKYYGKTGRLITGFSTVTLSLGLVAVQISVSGHILKQVLHIDYEYMVIASYLVVIIYTTIGGFVSVLFANILQFCVVIATIPLITILGLNKIGISNFIDNVPLDKISPIYNESIVYDTLIMFLTLSVMNLYPSTIKRMLINKNYNQTTKALWGKAVIYLLFIFLITINGLMLYISYPDHDSSTVLPYFISEITSSGSYGLIIIGLLATVMSTADADLNITAVSFVQDILCPIFNISHSKNLLLIARVSNIILGAISIIIALRFTSVIDLVIFMVGFWSTMILVPMIFALCDITISTKMFLVASLIGILSFLGWEIWCTQYIHYRLHGAFVGTIANLLFFLLAYFFKKK